MLDRSVIVALSTAPGRAALSVVRLTGEGLRELIGGILQPKTPGPLRHGRVRRVDVYAGAERIDDGLATFFESPRSYTGDDLCELSIHGNPRIVERVIETFLDAGARIATPGELTRRAVLRGKLDLVQAEAIDALVRATSEDGLRAARSLLDGALSPVLMSMQTEIVGIAAELEARLDWPDDDLAMQSDEALVAQLEAISQRARSLAESYRAGRIRIEGARVAIIGPVNAGKSSLFNRLLKEDRAIVHDRPGTTRDVVEARTMIGGIEVTLLDTAGERDLGEEILDPIEEMGVMRGRARAEDVDLLLVVVPADRSEQSSVRQLLDRTEGRRRVVVFNRSDREDARAPFEGALAVSALAQTGIEALESAIAEGLGEGSSSEVVLTSARQRDRLLAIAMLTAEASRALPLAGPAVSADLLVEALEEIDTTRGVDVRESVLDEVFRRFCIGK